MPSSFSSRYTGGTGVPAAMAISSTTFSILRSSGSRRLRVQEPPAQQFRHRLPAA